MDTSWLGIDVSGDEVTIAGLVLQEDGSIKHVIADVTWKLQTGPRSEAYRVMYDRVCTFISEKRVDTVVVEASALNPHVSVSHLESAELRGVVIASAAKSGANVLVISKSHISRNYGSRKTDQYITDSSFWTRRLNNHDLRKKGREAAMLVLMARKQQAHA